VACARVRAYDISNPYQPREIAYYVPGAPARSPKGAIQMNDVYIDDRGLVFAGDRFTGEAQVGFPNTVSAAPHNG